jgi:hypothetical protein
MIYLEVMHRKGRDNMMAKRNRTKRQTYIDETLHRKQKIEQSNSPLRRY